MHALFLINIFILLWEMCLLFWGEGNKDVAISGQIREACLQCTGELRDGGVVRNLDVAAIRVGSTCQGTGWWPCRVSGRLEGRLGRDSVLQERARARGRRHYADGASHSTVREWGGVRRGIESALPAGPQTCCCHSSLSVSLRVRPGAEAQSTFSVGTKAPLPPPLLRLHCVVEGGGNPWQHVAQSLQ